MFSPEQKYMSIIKRVSVTMLLFLAIFYFLYGGAELIRQVATQMIFEGSVTVDVLTSLLSSVAYMAGFILPAVLFYRLSKGKGSVMPDLSLRLPEEHSVLKVLAVLCVGLSVILTMAYLNSTLLPQPESDFGYDSFTAPYQVVLMFLSTAIVPAFVEELLFRGVIYTNLRPYGRSTAILISALLFGLMHQNFAQLLYATAAGVVLAFVYEMTGSFWCCVLLHFFNNYFAVLQEAWYSKYSEEMAALISILTELGIFFAGLLLAALWLYVERRKKSNAQADIRSFFADFSQTKTQIGAVSGNVLVKGFFNPFMIAFLVITAIEMIFQFIMTY